MQGFQEPPQDDFFVPYHTDWQMATMAGAGIMGKTRTERNLTYFGIDLSGHMGALLLLVTEFFFMMYCIVTNISNPPARHSTSICTFGGLSRTGGFAGESHVAYVHGAFYHFR